MYKRVLLLLLLSSLLLGCQLNQTEESTKNDTQFTKLSAENDAVRQQVSNQAKDVVSENEAVKRVNAVNNADKLIIAVEIDHLKRFRLKDIEKDLKDKAKQKFDTHKVELSTDQKILIELDDLEEKIRNDSVDEKKLDKEIDRIIKLSHEKT
jgi:ABC-type phosphate transport system auxiliary subunit